VTPDLRVTICSVGPEDLHLELPESRVGDDRRFPSGGERSLYELATAAATLGHHVELRGNISAPILETITTAAGAAPMTGMGPRPPEPGEIVVVPEGVFVPHLASAALPSGARPVIVLLAPPGLFGWSFRSGWTVPDPAVVPLDSLGTPETFRAIDGLGMTMWTNAGGIAAAGRAAGVAVTWLGTGTPVDFPEPQEKVYDVAVIMENRWYGAAEAIVEQLGDVSVLRIPAIANQYSLAEALSPARLLVWPSRVEGMSRISREARSVGTVPVALATNPFAEIDDWGDGIVLVPDVESLANEVRSLLGDPALINSLAVAARRGARAQADWDAYRSRLAGALEQVAAVRPEDEARAEIGALLRGSFASLRDEFASAREEFASAREEFEAILATNLVEIEKTSTELKRVCRELGRANGDLERTGAELSRVSGELARVKGEYASARLDSARELAAARSQADDLGSALAVAESELAAFRSRLLVRIVEQSGYGKLVGARRARQRSPEN
jgi:hypothetical protein